MIGFQNGREAGASLAHQPFFLLDNQVVRVFQPQRLVDYFKGSYIRGFWEDMFSSFKESVGKSLADHLLKMAAGWKRA